MKFVDLKAQFDAYKDEINAEISRVLESTAFINGPAVQELEERLADYVGVKHAIGCSSGTDALLIGLLSLGVGTGDEVIVPDFSFFATAETVSLLGAIPIFVDIDPETFNIDPDSIAAAITDRTVGVIPVSLFGQTSEMDAVTKIASENDLWVMEDAAQSFGAEYRGKKSCDLSPIAATSFFPAKPLGCYGDGGAIFTSNDAIAERVRMLVNHGQKQRYEHHLVGTNGRLDTLQAAILKVKLRHFDDELQQRQEIADWYDRLLKDTATVPVVRAGHTSVWAQYTVRIPNRDEVRSALQERGIPTSIHYPRPLHRQPAFSNHRQYNDELLHTERATVEVLSLPMHPFLSRNDVDTIATAIKEVLHAGN